MIDDATGPGLVPSPDGNAETNPGPPHGPEQDADATRLGFGARAGDDSAATVYLGPESDLEHTGESPASRDPNILRCRGIGEQFDRPWLGAVTASSGCSAPAEWVPSTSLRPGAGSRGRYRRRCARRLPADPETARALERRFKQEPLLARKVTHRNIVRVHDMGEVEGVKYITMPYLEGDDLSTVLNTDGKLPPTRVMAIARQVASGLAAAHDSRRRPSRPEAREHHDRRRRRGLDHGLRDRAIDGPARRLRRARPPPDEHQRLRARRADDRGRRRGRHRRVHGAGAGKGQPVDHRADIYAFGLILYDLLLGRSRPAAPRALSRN